MEELTLNEQQNDNLFRAGCKINFLRDNTFNIKNDRELTLNYDELSGINYILDEISKAIWQCDPIPSQKS